jgi:hypothetical protein
MSVVTASERSHLIAEAKELWLWAEAYRIGYQHRYRSKAQLAGILRGTTVVSAVLTAATTYPELQSIPYLTAVAAALTAAVAAVAQIVLPERSLRENWEILRKLESQQRDLSSRSRGMDNVAEYHRELFELQRIQKSVSDTVSSGIDITDACKEAARRNFLSERLDPVQEQLAPQYDVNDADEGMAEDAALDLSDITAPVRRVSLP